MAGLGRHALLAKLVGAYLAPTLVLLGAFGYFAYWLGRRSVEQELGHRLVAVAQSAATLVRPEQFAEIQPGDEEGSRTYKSMLRKLRDLAARTTVARVQLLDRDYNVRVDTRAGVAIGTPAFELFVDRSEIDGALAGRGAASVLFRGQDGQLYKRGYAPIAGEGNDIAGVVAVQGSAESLIELDRFRRFIIGYGALCAALLVAISAAVARRITRPLRELAGGARRIGGGDLSHAVTAPRSRDEIALLADTLEQMRQSLRARDQRLQMMLSGIAHEVRNPLGGIELFAGLLRDELAAQSGAPLAGTSPASAHLERIERELTHLKTIVADFLEYARRPPPETAPLDCASLLEDVRDVLAKDLAEARVVCTVRASGRPRAFADANQLRRALLNLLKNAIQATPPGGQVTLACENGDGRVRLSVADSGGGIAREKLDHIFTPFFTTKEKGTGLGLAFVRDIVRDHGGTIHVASEPGRGATFTIELRQWQESS